MMENNGQMITTDELDSLAQELPTNTTDPGTRREMILAMLRYNESPIERVEVQVVERNEAAGKKLPLYVLQKRWDVRLRDWMTAQATQPKRITRWLAWWIPLPWKIGSFFRVMLSHKLDSVLVVERDTVCDGCDQRYHFVRRDGETSDHCAACKCPATRFSTLAFKNERANWKCPLRKHAGPYPNDPQANALMELGYDENVVLSAVGGGCTGCGCGKK